MLASRGLKMFPPDVSSTTAVDALLKKFAVLVSQVAINRSVVAENMASSVLFCAHMEREEKEDSMGMKRIAPILYGNGSSGEVR